MGRVVGGPRYTAQFTWNDEPARAGLIRAWADAREVKVTELMREIVAAGLEVLVPRWQEEVGGTVSPKLVAQYVRESDRSAARRGGGVA